MARNKKSKLFLIVRICVCLFKDGDYVRTTWWRFSICIRAIPRSPTSPPEKNLSVLRNWPTTALTLACLLGVSTVNCKDEPNIVRHLAVIAGRDGPCRVCKPPTDSGSREFAVKVIGVSTTSYAYTPCLPNFQTACVFDGFPRTQSIRGE